MMDLLRSTAILAIPVLAYFLGWSYLDAYYDTFEIPLSNLHLPVEHYFTLGVFSLLRGVAYLPARWDWSYVWYVLLGLGVVSALLVNAAPIEALRRWHPFITGVSIAIIAGSGFMLTRTLGFENAMLQPPEVQLQLGSDDPGVAGDARLAQVNGNGDLRLIYWDENTVVIGALECPRSRQLDSFHTRLEQAAAAQRQSAAKQHAAVEPTSHEVAGFANELLSPSGRVRWSVWLLPARRVSAVSFQKAAEATQLGLERDVFLNCARQLPAVRGGGEEVKPPAPSSDSAAHSPRPRLAPAPAPAPPQPPSPQGAR